MNVLRVTLLAACLGSSSPTEGGISYAVWDLGQSPRVMEGDRLPSLAIFINSHCGLSQSEGASKTVQRLWEDLVWSSIGFSHTIVLWRTPVGVLWSAGHCHSSACESVDKLTGSALTTGPRASVLAPLNIAKGSIALAWKNKCISVIAESYYLVTTF